MEVHVYARSGDKGPDLPRRWCSTAAPGRSLTCPPQSTARIAQSLAALASSASCCCVLTSAYCSSIFYKNTFHVDACCLGTKFDSALKAYREVVHGACPYVDVLMACAAQKLSKLLWIHSALRQELLPPQGTASLTTQGLSFRVLYFAAHTYSGVPGKQHSSGRSGHGKAHSAHPHLSAHPHHAHNVYCAHHRTRRPRGSLCHPRRTAAPAPRAGGWPRSGRCQCWPRRSCLTGTS